MNKSCQTCAFDNIMRAYHEFRTKAGPNGLGYQPGKPCKYCGAHTQWTPAGCLRVRDERRSFRMYYNCEECAHCWGDWDKLFANVGLRGLWRRRCTKCSNGWLAQPWVGQNPTRPPHFVPAGCLTIRREKPVKRA